MLKIINPFDIQDFLFLMSAFVPVRLVHGSYVPRFMSYVPMYVKSVEPLPCIAVCGL